MGYERLGVHPNGFIEFELDDPYTALVLPAPNPYITLGDLIQSLIGQSVDPRELVAAVNNLLNDAGH